MPLKIYGQEYTEARFEVDSETGYLRIYTNSDGGNDSAVLLNRKQVKAVRNYLGLQQAGVKE